SGSPSARLRRKPPALAKHVIRVSAHLDAAPALRQSDGDVPSSGFEARLPLQPLVRPDREFSLTPSNPVASATDADPPTRLPAHRSGGGRRRRVPAVGPIPSVGHLVLGV